MHQGFLGDPVKKAGSVVKKFMKSEMIDRKDTEDMIRISG